MPDSNRKRVFSTNNDFFFWFEISLEDEDDYADILEIFAKKYTSLRRDGKIMNAGNYIQTVPAWYNSLPTRGKLMSSNTSITFV